MLAIDKVSAYRPLAWFRGYKALNMVGSKRRLFDRYMFHVDEGHTKWIKRWTLFFGEEYYLNRKRTETELLDVM